MKQLKQASAISVTFGSFKTIIFLLYLSQKSCAQTMLTSFTPIFFI